MSKAYYKITESGYSVGSKLRDGFTEYSTDNVPTELQALFDAENLIKVVEDGVAATDAYIQFIIDTYNEAHSVKFGSIHNMAIYTLDPTYEHYQFALDIIAFNKSVWETVRLNMPNLLSGIPPNPTEAELIALLPVYQGVV